MGEGTKKESTRVREKEKVTERERQGRKRETKRE